MTVSVSPTTSDKINVECTTLAGTARWHLEIILSTTVADLRRQVVSHFRFRTVKLIAPSGIELNKVRSNYLVKDISNLTDDDVGLQSVECEEEPLDNHRRNLTRKRHTPKQIARMSENWKANKKLRSACSEDAAPKLVNTPALSTQAPESLMKSFPKGAPSTAKFMQPSCKASHAMRIRHVTEEEYYNMIHNIPKASPTRLSPTAVRTYGVKAKSMSAALSTPRPKNVSMTLPIGAPKPPPIPIGARRPCTANGQRRA